jgi:Flp pilus assembly protein TadG
MIARALKKRIRGGWSGDERGQAQVEFILTALPLLLLIFGIFEMIMLLYTYNVLADSAKEGVRYAIVHGADSATPSTGSGCSTSAATNVISAVQSYAKLSFHNVSSMTVDVCYPDGNTSSASDPPNEAQNRVRVTVSYPYAPFLGLKWEKGFTISAAAEGRIAF